jgi:hypothetical protein
MVLQVAVRDIGQLTDLALDPDRSVLASLGLGLIFTGLACLALGVLPLLARSSRGR